MFSAHFCSPDCSFLAARYIEYYQKRSGNPKQQGWSEQITAKLSEESRPFMLSYLQRKGLALK